eukprot:Rmarinus@m.108
MLRVPVALLLASLLFPCFAANDDDDLMVYDIHDSNFPALTGSSGLPWLLMFFDPRMDDWKSILPAFHESVYDLNEHYNLGIGNVLVARQLARRFGLKELPTIVYYQPSTGAFSQYKGPINPETYVNYYLEKAHDLMEEERQRHIAQQRKWERDGRAEPAPHAHQRIQRQSERVNELIESARKKTEATLVNEYLLNDARVSDASEEVNPSMNPNTFQTNPKREFPSNPSGQAIPHGGPAAARAKLDRIESAKQRARNNPSSSKFSSTTSFDRSQRSDDADVGSGLEIESTRINWLMWSFVAVCMSCTAGLFGSRSRAVRVWWNKLLKRHAPESRLTSHRSV